MPEFSVSSKDLIPASHRETLAQVYRDYRVSIVSCVHFRNKAPWSLAWRTCPDSFFLFPTEGTLRVHLDSGTFDLRRGEFLMLREEVPHALEIGPSSPRLHQISLHCRIVNRWGHDLLFRTRATRGILTAQSHFHTGLAELSCLLAHDPEAAQQRGESFVKELLAMQLRAGLDFTPAQQEGDPRVAAVLEKMETAFANPDLSVEGLAKEVQITAVQLRKLFRRETAHSPRRFLNRLRLRNAARLLRQGTASVKEVAAECGFTSDHYFHLAFRKEYGCTPSNYRLNRMSHL